MEDEKADRDHYSGMIRLHILHHAGRGAIFGAGMAEELARHGYKISPGTLYPILHGLENVVIWNRRRSDPAKVPAGCTRSRPQAGVGSKQPRSVFASFLES